MAWKRSSVRIRVAPPISFDDLQESVFKLARFYFQAVMHIFEVQRAVWQRFTGPINAWPLLNNTTSDD